jgi:hypothetical protein
MESWNAYFSFGVETHVTLRVEITANISIIGRNFVFLKDIPIAISAKLRPIKSIFIPFNCQNYINVTLPL